MIAEGGPLALDEAARIGLALASAVASAHAAGVAHRDLKPANVLLDGDGHPRITDFGLARRLSDERHLTATDQILGTPAYLPPEVARAEPNIDWVRADVYGLGAVLFAAITGRPPVEGLTKHQRIEAASRGTRRSLRKLRPEVPVALDAVVSKALCPEAAGRYADAAALAEDLRRYLAGDPVLARPETALERVRRWARRKAVPLSVGILVGAAIVLAAGWAPLNTRLEAGRREAAARRAWESMQASLGTPAGDTLLHSFLDAPEFYGTTAVAEAWLWKGDEADARPRPRDEWSENIPPDLSLWARALTEAPDDITRGAALLRLARAALEQGSFVLPDLGPDPVWPWTENRRIRGPGYRNLRSLVRALEALPSGAVPEAELLPLQVASSLYDGDRAGAAAAWDRAVALDLPAARFYADPRWIPDALSQGERLFVPKGEGVLTQARDPGDPAVILRTGDQLSRLLLMPSAHTAGTVTLPDLRPFFTIWPEAGPEQRIFDGTELDWGDVDGDGMAEAYQAFGRVVYRLAPDGRSRTPILPETLRTSSEAVVEAADLDGDGRDELVVGLAEWRAYDLRVYDFADGRYTLRARTRRNATRSLATVPDPWGKGRLLVSVEDSRYSSAYKHGMADPGGPPDAIVVRRLVGDRLDEVWTWVVPGWGGLVLQPRVADIDGDGRAEVLLRFDQDTLPVLAVLRPGDAPDTLGVSLFPGWLIEGARQLDDDPAFELVATWTDGQRADQVWILGRGAQVPPTQASAPENPGLLPPEGALHGPLAWTWRDAVLLSGAGLDDDAASLLARSATLAGDAEAAAAASSLWVRAQHLGEAAHAMEVAAAASGPGLAPARWQAAVHLWLSLGDPESALRAAAAWRAADGTGPSGALAETLSGWEQARKQSWRLVPGAALTEPWQIEEPLIFDLSADATHLSLVGTGARARLPLVSEGGPLAMILDAVIDAREWRAHGLLSLQEEGRVGLGLSAVVPGAEKVSMLSLSCDGVPSILNSLMLPHAGTAPPAPVQVTLRLAWSPAEAMWRCTIAAPDQRREASISENGQPPDALTLELRDFGWPGERMGIRLDRLELWGLRPAVETLLDARQQANLALLRQDPAGALALLPPDADVDRAVALALLRRPVEAVALLERALKSNSEALNTRVGALLRGRRDTFGPLVRAASGPRWPELFHAVYARPAIGTDQVPDVEDALRSDLEGVALPQDPEDPRWNLLAWRAGALLRGPDPARGRLAAQQWLDAFAAMHLPRDADLAYAASGVHRELAFAAAAAGDLETAKREAQAAVDVSPTPVVAPDRFEVSEIWKKAGLPLPVARPWD